ncbi:D-alanyl-D-alanine carboxypeptidase family protein [Endothiovibrio diazotrophicus]
MRTPFPQFIGTLLLLVSGLAHAAALPVPSAPELAAKGYLLMDYDSGQVLVEEAARERMEPASITKLMTAYVVFQALREGTIQLTDKVRISEKAWRMPGSRMFIEVGKQVDIEDLIRGMIVQSGNDASVALAEHVAGDEGAFADLMNRYARKLGMNATHFVNATGLPDPEHYTTAYDIALLTRALIHEYPDHYKLYSEKKFTWNGITQYNRNKLLWRDPSVDGVKTGHTESAGFCLVTSALREGMRLISVVLGTKSEKARASESQKLINYGFRFFESHRLYAAGKPLTEARAWMGAADKLPLGLARDLHVVIPRGQYKQLKATMEVQSSIIAPVAKGGEYGQVNVTLDGKPLASVPLVAYQEIPEGSLWQKMTDKVMMMFQ